MRGGWGLSLALVVGIAGACADDSTGTVVLADACDVEEALACVKLSPNSDKLENIGVCRDGSYELLMRCPELESCMDMGGGVAACTEVNTHVPYAIEGAACDLGGELACDTDRDNVLSCEGGEWIASQDCTIEIQRCAVPTGGDTPTCEDES